MPGGISRQPIKKGVIYMETYSEFEIDLICDYTDKIQVLYSYHDSVKKTIRYLYIDLNTYEIEIPFYTFGALKEYIFEELIKSLEEMPKYRLYTLYLKGVK
jgi:hypothetical protein